MSFVEDDDMVQTTSKDGSDNAKGDSRDYEKINPSYKVGIVFEKPPPALPISAIPHPSPGIVKKINTIVCAGGTGALDEMPRVIGYGEVFRRAVAA